MSDAVRRLVRVCYALDQGRSIHNERVLSQRPIEGPLWKELIDAARAVEAELNAPPAVTDAPGFDGRSTDYPDMENYR